VAAGRACGCCRRRLVRRGDPTLPDRGSGHRRGRGGSRSRKRGDQTPLAAANPGVADA
jgi:hypothetical protein